MSISRSVKKWTFNLSHYDYAKFFFLTLSFISMISAGVFAIPLVSDFFLKNDFDWNRDWTSVLFSITSTLGCIWGLMAQAQFDAVTKLVRNTWHLCSKLDPIIGEYEYKTLNPETNQLEDGYVYHGLVDFWDRDNEVPHWLDKGKYWKIFLELQKINKKVKLEVTKDANLPFDQGKSNLVVILKEFNHADTIVKQKNYSSNTKIVAVKIVIPQWLVINTEYKRFNIFSRSEISNITSIISEVNKNIPKIIDEIIFKEKPVLKHSGSVITSISVYLNKSLPLRIIYNKTKEILPGAKKRQIQNTDENLSRVSLDYLIESILLKAKTVGIKELSLAKLYSLSQFLKKEYDKLGLGEGSSEYHNLHHSLEVAYMSLNMLPREIHGYTISSRDYEIMLVAALLHDYDPVQGTTHPNSKFYRIPTVASTVSEVKRKKIHDAYFSLTSDEFIKFFRKHGSPLLPAIDYATTHPDMLKGTDDKIESKIVEALIWRTDYPYDENAQNNFNLLLKEIDNQEFSVEKINLIAEILSLSDLSVTYLSSDPLLAWDRVVKLYEELDFPLVEAVSRTDRFLSLFSEGSLFKDIISRKNFPEVFRQKWNNVYQFFHEGNPSNKINNLILDAKTKYQKVNIDMDTDSCDLLINIAIQKKEEFFIGLVKEKDEIINTQSKLSGLQIDNLEILPGSADNILPFIKDKFIDNFILTIFSDSSVKIIKKEKILRNLLHSYNSKLSYEGTIQIIVEKEKDIEKIITLIPNHDFKIINTEDKVISRVLTSDKSENTKYSTSFKIITIQNFHSRE